MSGFSHVAALALVFLSLSGCGGAPSPAPSTAALAAPTLDPPDKTRGPLEQMVDRYWREHVLLDSAPSPQAMADALAVERRYLAGLSAVSRASLDANSMLTYDIFKRRLEAAVEGFTYPEELLVVDPFRGMPQQTAQMAEDVGQPPAVGGRDHESWSRRIDDYSAWTHQAIANMREGLRRGYISPRAVVERGLPGLERLGADTPANLFYQRLGAGLSGAIKDKLLPAYRDLHDFLQREYLPRARPSLALSALPLGNAWYAYRVRVRAGTILTPEQIHELGVGEVARIRARMAAAVAPEMAPSLAPTASLSAAAGSTAAGSEAAPDMGSVLSALTELKTQTLAAMPGSFSANPPVDIEIRAGRSVGDAASPLRYVAAAADGARSAILYVDPAAHGAPQAGAYAANFLQAVLPGIHYQTALQRARSDLPIFRRFGTEPAFVEGWGLYATSLGEEMGLYRDVQSKAVALDANLRCAVALVVDTGLHAQGWTRQRALDYLHAQLSIDEVGANLLIDRLAASPGDAMACKIGELKFQSLRSRAQQLLGARFDIRDFHAQVLDGGAMPLDILEVHFNAWPEGLR